MPLTEQERNELTTLRWMFQEGIANYVTEGRRILDRLIGYPAPGSAATSSPAPKEEEKEAGEPLTVTPLYSGSKFPMIGCPFLEDSFKAYLNGIPSSAMTWNPSGVTIHHCAAPSLAQRPNGFLQQHLRNIRDFYIRTYGWNCGPHFFTDEDQIWAFSPVTSKGIHAKSFNSTHIGIEMLGNYDTEDPKTGRGLQVATMTAKATAALMKRFSIPITRVNFHRDDPKTSKTCPGTKVNKDWFLGLVRNEM